jgi:hypothetical protein
VRLPGARHSSIAAATNGRKEAKMKTQIGRVQKRVADGNTRTSAQLAALVQLLRAAKRSQLRDQRLTATGQSRRPAAIEFVGRQPYGFVFTEDQEASFRVPSGHRFVIQQVNISAWGDNGALSLRLVTTSPRMCRRIPVASFPAQSAADDASGAAVTPLVVNGLSANTFLFSDRKLHNSPTVPSDTYLQIWGYLEPTSFPNELLCAKDDASLRGTEQVNHDLWRAEAGRHNP